MSRADDGRYKYTTQKNRRKEVNAVKMKQNNIAAGFAAGLVLGAVVLSAFGQNEEKKGKSVQKKAAPKTATQRTYTVPRYSVQYDSNQQLLLITDNAFSQLYLYDTGKSGANQLRSRIDLRQTGASQLRAVVPRSRAVGPGKTKAKPKAKPRTPKKLLPKKPAPKKK